MSNKKQSSIDKFAIALCEKGFIKGYGNEINNLFEEHKAMHKQEMKDLYLSHVTKATRLREIFEKQFEELYNETFGGEKN